MLKIRTLAGAGAITVAMALAPLAAQAQSAAPAAAGGFDAYRALAVTVGVIGGATVAVVATDGLIVPLYAMATGGQAGGWSLASSMAAGAGAGAGEIAVASGMTEPITHLGYYAFRSTMALLGMVGGGFYADSWYKGG